MILKLFKKRFVKDCSIARSNRASLADSTPNSITMGLTSPVGSGSNPIMSAWCYVRSCSQLFDSTPRAGPAARTFPERPDQIFKALFEISRSSSPLSPQSSRELQVALSKPPPPPDLPTTGAPVQPINDGKRRALFHSFPRAAVDTPDTPDDTNRHDEPRARSLPLGHPQ